MPNTKITQLKDFILNKFPLVESNLIREGTISCEIGSWLDESCKATSICQNWVLKFVVLSDGFTETAIEADIINYLQKNGFSKYYLIVENLPDVPIYERKNEESSKRKIKAATAFILLIPFKSIKNPIYNLKIDVYRVYNVKTFESFSSVDYHYSSRNIEGHIDVPTLDMIKISKDCKPEVYCKMYPAFYLKKIFNFFGKRFSNKEYLRYSIE